MEVWIILDGEKTGPLHDFEVRRRIESGTLPPDAHAWHEGLDGWKPLSEIPLFTREFEIRVNPLQAAPEEPVILPESPRKLPPPLPQPKAYGRRFCARWLDLMLYGGVWWICMWAARQNIEAALMNPWVLFVQFVPWFIIEALLLHYVGNTPGKWILNMKVVNNDGSRLSLAESTRRSLSVMFTGVGFGWGLLAVFCQTLSYVTARRLGTTLWDHTGGHRVQVGSLTPLRIVLAVLLLFAAAQLQSLVLYPHYEKFVIQQRPELKEYLDKNAVWHLPQRHRQP